ncbi:MAG TPA: C39 family peptidase [Chloroflexota bacterium]|nr:C39 family peptidase [Chloroflexota bacterium]
MAFRSLGRVVSAAAVAVVFLGPAHPSHAASGPVILAGFPTLRQQHTLTCEASAASMGTQGALSEGQIMAVMPRSPDPNRGFRGNPDGEQGTRLVDYGVYAGPIQKALARYGYDSRLVMEATRGDIEGAINGGRPVVVWVTYALQHAVPRLEQWHGRPFVLVPHEHAVLAVGYDAHHIVANDPWTAKQVQYTWTAFEHSWDLFGNMALIMDPCPTPASVPNLAVQHVSTAGVTWTWGAARYAVQYDVTVREVSPVKRLVQHGRQTARTLTLVSPIAGASYRIDVRGVAACGIASLSPTRLWVTLPAPLPTPSPTATEGTSPVSTSTPTPSPATTGTPTG